MPDVSTVVQDYIATWNEADPQRRRALVERTFAEDATYVDPLMAGDGTQQIDAMIEAVQQAYPGHRFELAGAPDAHHDRVLFSWHLLGEQGRVATGLDVATLAGDGRLREVTGFLEAA
jgi:hypothetical protein